MIAILTCRRCSRIVLTCVLMLVVAATACGQLSMAPNLIGKQLLAGPNPAEDPNFPAPGGKVRIADLGGDVTWTRHQGIVLDWHQAGDPDFGVNIPQVLLPKLPSGRPPGTGDYLGFLEGQGSLLEAGPKGGVYVFNARAAMLTKKWDTVEQIPPDVLAALKNRKYIYESSHDPVNVLTAGLTEADHASVPAEAKPYEADANLSGTPGDNFPLTWDEPRTSFQVKLPQMQPVAAMYLGFNQRGSWIASALGKLYLWNLSSKTLTEVSDNWWDAPLDLRNASAPLQAMIFFRQHQYRVAAGLKQSPDPNFPPMMATLSRLYLKTVWEFQGDDLTRLVVYREGGTLDQYLGFDERGAWIQGAYGGIYVWSYRTWKVERLASRLSNIPRDALVRVHNANGLVK